MSKPPFTGKVRWFAVSAYDSAPHDVPEEAEWITREAATARADAESGTVVEILEAPDGDLVATTYPPTWDPAAALLAVDVDSLEVDHVGAESVRTDWRYGADDGAYGEGWSIAYGHECTSCGHPVSITYNGCECPDCGAEVDPTEEDPDAGMPMMSYAYRADGIDTDRAALLVHLPLTIVEVHDEDTGPDGLEEGTWLALTGGGMDLSWEIAEAYVLLGFLPPATFADLPGIAGRGDTSSGGESCEPSARDRIIMAACHRSLLERADSLKRRAAATRDRAGRLAARMGGAA